MENQHTTWQVDVGGQIYDAVFNELGEWISDGSLLPQDKVRKGNLRWIEAQKVPGLAPFFNAKANGEPMPLTVTKTEAYEADFPVVAAVEPRPNTAAFANPSEIGPQLSEMVDVDHCTLHPELESFYICETCCSGFCKGCPTSYGGSVKICATCGAMCKPVAEARAEARQVANTSAAIATEFGMPDFLSALSYPLKFKVSLVLGAIMFMFLTLGKGAASMGGIYMVVGGIFSGMSANALTFGVLSNTINNFVQGQLEANFMPEFENFDVWEDVVHPFFLSIAAYLSSFGPFLVVLTVGFYLVTNTVNSDVDTYKNELEKIPGTHVYAGRELVDQSGDVKDVLNRINEKEKGRIAAATESAAADANVEIATTETSVDQETRDIENVTQIASQSQKTQLESVLGKSPETRAMEDAAMANAFLRLSPPLVVIGLITFLWGLVYFPAASAVAGYTRSFTATINPFIGIDTIKRLGKVYVKLLAMGLCLLLVSVGAGGIFGLIFTPFDLPGFGNLPATAISALLTFYLMVVFSCILGYALYKNADKLGLSR